MSDNNDAATPAEAATKKKRSWGMSEKILLGLGLGILTGLFFGEAVGPLKVLGDAFVGLLQMTVMPYIVLALIGGIGKLSRKQGKLLLGKVSLIILGLWSIGFYSIILFGMLLPEQHVASFFSPNLIKEPPQFDFFSLFIPSNPFSSLSQNKVPAVVLFSLLCGAALMGLGYKQKIISAADMLLEMLGRVTSFVVNLSPLGVFFIAASAAGTMNIDDLARIQGYLVMLTVICVTVCFVLVPLLIKAFSDFTISEVSPLLRASFVLAFATGKTLIVLPLLIQGIQDIYKKRGTLDDEVGSTVDVLVPLAYSFPHLGRIMATAFIPFAAWYIGSTLSADQYPLLIGASTFVHFSNAPISIPFLLDLMRLPSDLFQLFVVTGVYVGRLTDAVGAAYILAVTVLGTAAVTGTLRPKWHSLGSLAVGVVLFSVLITHGGRWYLHSTADSDNSKENVIASMQVLRDSVPSVQVEPGPNPVPLVDGQSRLDRIRARGVLRVGFDPNQLPFSYINSFGEPAGFDVELANHLATDLGASIEYVPIEREADVPAGFAMDYYDIAIGGFVDTVGRSQVLEFSDPYLFVNMAIVVPDYRDKEFATTEHIAELGAFKLGVLSDGMFDEKIQRYFPEATVVRLNSPRDYFEWPAEGEQPDALLIAAESGSAWTILYPRYTVVMPLPRAIRVPLVIPYSGEADPKMDEFIDNWIMLRGNDGSFGEIFDYWILGQGTEDDAPRWSILRDVLGWVE